MNGAHESALASVVSAAVVVDLDARSKTKAGDETLAVEKGVEVHPDMTVCRPRPAGGNHVSSLIADILLGRLQMLT